MDVKIAGQGGQASIDYSLNQSQNALSNEKSLNAVGSNTEQTAAGSGSKEVDEASVKKSVDKLNKLLEGNSTHVEYEVHDKFKDIIVKVVDNNTKQVISEMPSKKVLDMVAKLCEMAGLFVDKKA